MNPELKPNPGPEPPKLEISRGGFLFMLFLAGMSITGIWIAGLEQHQTLWHNASVASILITAVFLLLVVTGLYTGIRPRCRPGKITGGILPIKRFLRSGTEIGCNFASAADSLAGFIIALLLSFLLGTISAALFWLLHVLILCLFFLIFYIFSRALNWIFRHRHSCKGNLATSIGYGLGYTLIYGSVVFSIPVVLHYFIL